MHFVPSLCNYPSLWEPTQNLVERRRKDEPNAISDPALTQNELRISCSSFIIHRGSSTLRNPSRIYNPHLVQTTPNFDECRKKRRTASAAGWQQRRSSREPLREADEVALCHSGHVKLEKKRKLELLLRASNHPKPYNDTRKLASPLAQDFGAEADSLGSTNSVDFNRSLGHEHDNNSN